MQGIQTPGHHEMSAEFKKDVDWWLGCMNRFNGKVNIVNTLNTLAVAVITRGDWFVFGWGEETKLCQWDYDDIIERVWRREGSLMTLIMPLQCVNNRCIREVMTIIYCSMYFIYQRDTKLCPCCRFLASVNTLTSAKSTVGWQLQSLHRYFWWCVDQNVFVEPIHVYL